MAAWGTLPCPDCGARIAVPMRLRDCGCISVDHEAFNEALARHLETSEREHPSACEVG